MPGLDEFYRYLERQEPEPRAPAREAPVPAPGSTRPGTHFVVRGGVTIAVTDTGEEVAAMPAPVARAPRSTPSRIPAHASKLPTIEQPIAPAVLPPAHPQTDAEGAALWEALPRHVQLLANLVDGPESDPSLRTFEETREQLIHRLLDPTLTLEETARLLGVCTATVRRYTNRGQLGHHRTLGQQRRFRLSDVLGFLEKRAVRAAEPARTAETDDDRPTSP